MANITGPNLLKNIAGNIVKNVAGRLVKMGADSSGTLTVTVTDVLNDAGAFALPRYEVVLDDTVHVALTDVSNIATFNNVPEGDHTLRFVDTEDPTWYIDTLHTVAVSGASTEYTLVVMSTYGVVLEYSSYSSANLPDGARIVSEGGFSGELTTIAENPDNAYYLDSMLSIPEGLRVSSAELTVWLTSTQATDYKVYLRNGTMQTQVGQPFAGATAVPTGAVLVHAGTTVVGDTVANAMAPIDVSAVVGTSPSGAWYMYIETLETTPNNRMVVSGGQLKLILERLP